MRYALACLLLLGTGGCDLLFSIDDLGGGGDLRFVQSASVANTPLYETSLSVTLPDPPVAGDTLIVAIAVYREAIAGITDNAGVAENHYALTPVQPAKSPAAEIWIYSATVRATHDPFTITVATLPDATGPQHETSIAVHEYGGLSSATAVKSATMSGLDGTMPSCGPLAIGSKPTLVFAAMTHDGAASSAPGPDATRRELVTDDIDNHIPLLTEDQLSPTNPAEAQFLLDTSSSWGCGALTFE